MGILRSGCRNLCCSSESNKWFGSDWSAKDYFAGFLRTIWEHFTSGGKSKSGFDVIAGREANMYKLILTSLLCVSLWQPARADVLYGAVQYKNVTGRIGVSINRKGMIRGVHPDSPAAQAGLVAGDVVEVVNGKPGDVWHIHGTPDTYVKLFVRRGSSHFSVQVKRIDGHSIKRELDREHNSQPEPQTASKGGEVA